MGTKKNDDKPAAPAAAAEVAAEVKAEELTAQQRLDRESARLYELEAQRVASLNGNPFDALTKAAEFWKKGNHPENEKIARAAAEPHAPKKKEAEKKEDEPVEDEATK